MDKTSTKVIVGMSGGVDSSVAALLLLEQGYQVEGLFMKNWEEDDSDSHCSATLDLNDATDVCQKLGIKLHTANFAMEYWDNVFDNFLREYKAGRTPNPDILCNKEIKFKAFLDYAKLLGADFIATGHYAGIAQNHNGATQLLKADDSNKDQSYFLYALSQQQIKHALFPLANITKDKVRALAQKSGFANSSKKDSTGICFIGERKFKQFLQTYIPAQPGNIINTENEVIGSHDGLMYYTLGQRQGLGIGGIKNAANEAWFVVDKDLTNNQLVVAQGTNHPRLFAKGLIAQQLTWIDSIPATEFTCTAKIRYRQNDQQCKVIIDKETNTATVIFVEDQRAITPGQSVVFYDNNLCLGGGIIEERIWKI